MDTYPVIEFRRYTTVEGGQAAFTRYFETLFPEAFQQLGALALGQFTERGNPNSFLWMRGFTSWEQRAVANAAFYYGPVWKEHKATLNGLMTDSDNVLLLRPCGPAAACRSCPLSIPCWKRTARKAKPSPSSALCNLASSNALPNWQRQPSQHGTMPAGAVPAHSSRSTCPTTSRSCPYAVTARTWCG